MFGTRFDRAEKLRAQVQDSDGVQAVAVAALAGGDAAALQTAWTGFVPLLAHPVMASSASGAMDVLEAAVGMVVTRKTAAA